MKKIIVLSSFLFLSISVFAQKYITRSGKISFFSETPVENIEAFNNEVAAAINTTTGDVIFQVPIKSFKFENQLMQEHFNENYLESDKFPKSEFKGKIKPLDDSKNGVFSTIVSGKLTLHGVTKEIQIPGTVTIKGGEIILNTKFKISPSDYQINIPSVAAIKIAKQIEVTVNTILKKP